MAHFILVEADFSFRDQCGDLERFSSVEYWCDLTKGRNLTRGLRSRCLDLKLSLLSSRSLIERVEREWLEKCRYGCSR